MFLLNTTGLVGEETNVVGTYWPTLLIGWGVWGILRSGFRLRLGSLIILALGVVFLLSNLKIWAWNAGQLWPVLLVLLGLAIISRLGRPSRWVRRRIGRRRSGSARETVVAHDSAALTCLAEDGSGSPPRSIAAERFRPFVTGWSWTCGKPGWGPIRLPWM